MKLELVTDHNFCEDDYLIANPDVRAAVSAGGFTSGRQHFDRYGFKEARSQRAPLVFFLHIPKTGGSSVHAHLKEYFPDGSAHCETWLYGNASMHLLDTLSWVSGHVRYCEASPRVRKFTNRRVEYFTCVRNPTDQVRSHYNWLIELFYRGDEWYGPSEPWVKELSEKIRTSGFSVQTIQKNLLDHRDFFLNSQYFWISDTFVPSDSTLDNFVYIATTDTLTALLCAMIGKDVPVTRFENASHSHFEPALFYSSEMQSFFREYNARDNQLYALVLARLDRSALLPNIQVQDHTVVQ